MYTAYTSLREPEFYWPKEETEELETPRGSIHLDELLLPIQSSDGRKYFVWNGRKCRGVDLHVAAVGGDLEGVMRALEQSSKVSIQGVNERFTYETFFKGQVQEGSGEAIHLAVSRGHLNVAKFLISCGAKITAAVTRGGMDHYDVLHAALFAEGLGGRPDMISFLLESKAQMSKNLDLRTPLHIAFQTGNLPVIGLLREHMQKAETSIDSSEVCTALELGISHGKMSQDQLAEAADLTPESLNVFIYHCPQCIPAFLNRFEGGQQVTAAEWAKHLTSRDLAKVLRECPEAASALLRHVTGEPEIENKGWHSLPTRVSFAPYDLPERFRLVTNPLPDFITFYEQDTSWNFDGRHFIAPAWHQRLTDRGAGRPIIDASVNVCLIPNIICPEVFSALSSNLNNLSIYDNDIICCCIQHVFWRGVSRVDLTQVLIVLWGLTLIVLERVLVSVGWSGSTKFRDEDFWISISFVAAKGFIDLLIEIIQLLGYHSIGRFQDYFQLKSYFSLCMALFPMYLFFFPGSRLVMLFIIAIYWGRLLGCFTSAEYIAQELHPIIQLTYGLRPALVVTAVAFAAFTHVFYTLADSGLEPRPLWPDVFFESFSVLIVAGIPDLDSGSDIDSLRWVVIYIAVVFFTVFILNIFISVIDYQYKCEKAQVTLSIRKLRADSSYQFLLRSRIMPCRLSSKEFANCMLSLATLLAFAVQMYCLINELQYQAWVAVAFVFFQGTIVFSSYQDQDSPWFRSRRSGENYFLWFAKHSDKPETNQDLAENISFLTARLETMTERMCSKASD